MKKVKEILITIGIGLLCTLFISMMRGIFDKSTEQEVFHVLCDAFFIVGVVITGIGLLIICSNEGAFDMIVYGTTMFINWFRRKNERKYETYYDYVVAKSEKKTGFSSFLISGIFFLLMSLLMLMLYYK
ncbi:MAG: DUF3899 domain-containing protein [Bacilli bacterium]|nr:DUF3899 domain-containing protein [Bacilli bacterium]